MLSTLGLTLFATPLVAALATARIVSLDNFWAIRRPIILGRNRPDEWP